MSIKNTVLVVDDDSSTRSMIVDALESTGIFVIEAENGLDALKLFRAHPCNLIISDIKMPGMSGLDLLIKVMESNPGMHMIMITGFPTLDLTVSVIKTGAVDLMAKPFDIDELIHKVQIYLREQEILSHEEQREKRDTQKLKDKANELSTRDYIYDSIENTKDSNDHIFQEMADLAIKLVGAESCAILLYEAEAGKFNSKVIRSSAYDYYKNEILPFLQPHFLKVVEAKKPLMVSAQDQTGMANALICVPLKIRTHVFGIMSLSRKRNGADFNQRDLDYIVSLTKRAALNLENKILYESTYTNIISTFRSLAASIQLRDHYTEEHSVRVTEHAIQLAKAMELPEQQIESLRISGMLHDIGKVAIPDNVLLKPDRLTLEEFMIIRNHPLIGETILKPVLFFENEIKAIRHHHERWDGKGYPDGLAGETIPLNARILSVVDSYDAMTNNRPYRMALSIDQAIAELQRNRAIQFDEKIVDAFLKLL